MADYKVINTAAAADIKIISDITVADIRSVTGDAKQPSSGYEGVYALDGIDKFTSINNMEYTAAPGKMRGGSWMGPWVGISKASPTATGWNAACRSVAEIQGDVGALMYVEWKMDLAAWSAWDIMIGLGYVDDDNCGGAEPYDWCTWQWWLTAQATKMYCGPCPGVEAETTDQNWCGGGATPTPSPNAAAYRTCRIEVNSNVVSWRYKDGAGAWTTLEHLGTPYTSPRLVDIAGNSNLVASVTVNSPHGYAATPENLKIYGNLVNT